MNADQINARIKQLEEAVEKSLETHKGLEKGFQQSLANHNALLGALQETKNWLDVVNKAAGILSEAVPAELAVD